ncbi:MAG: redoxin family protein [Nitrososphaerota archaeon]|nr:redoxin family protein [Nitrososphaerota archaeon]
MSNRSPQRRRNGRGRKGAKRKLLLVSLGVLVVLVAAGIGAYAFYNHQQQANTTEGTGTTTLTTSTGIDAGDRAPDMPIYLTNGTSTSLSSFQGHAVLVWMVATWCPGCQESAPVIASQYYSQLRSAGVTLITVEDYNDLGYSGPTMTQFASQYAGGVDSHPGWLFADTSQSATYTYNPQADLDIWYLIGPSGTIVTSGLNLGTTIHSAITAVDNLQTASA